MAGKLLDISISIKVYDKSIERSDLKQVNLGKSVSLSPMQIIKRCEV